MKFSNIDYLREIADKIHIQNKKKGFWEEVNSTNRQCCLIMTELAESILTAYFKAEKLNGQFNPDAFSKYVKDTFEDEICDAWIRI